MCLRSHPRTPIRRLMAELRCSEASAHRYLNRCRELGLLDPRKLKRRLRRGGGALLVKGRSGCARTGDGRRALQRGATVAGSVAPCSRRRRWRLRQS